MHTDSQKEGRRENRGERSIGIEEWKSEEEKIRKEKKELEAVEM